MLGNKGFNQWTISQTMSVFLRSSQDNLFISLLVYFIFLVVLDIEPKLCCLYSASTLALNYIPRPLNIVILRQSLIKLPKKI